MDVYTTRRWRISGILEMHVFQYEDRIRRSVSLRQLRFYRAKLCVSAVIAIDRCLSVCASVTLLYCIQRDKDITNFFLGLVVPSR